MLGLEVQAEGNRLGSCAGTALLLESEDLIVRGGNVVRKGFTSNGGDLPPAVIKAAGPATADGMWDDFRRNCENANVPPSQLCEVKSAQNPDGRGPSYLDVYRNEIANRAHELGLPRGFRPTYFAYHGWHDTNRYIDDGAHCGSYETCTVRRLLRSLRGSWGDVIIWNTEDGVGQTSAPDDREQACAAAFLLRLNTISPRIRRLYITRLRGGAGTLITPLLEKRPAYHVLAKRQHHFNDNCR